MKALVLTAMAGLASLGPAFAGERAATETEIRRLVVGHVLKCGGADCHYGADGTYYRNGQDPGRYTISPGSICVASMNGGNRCDRIVVNDNGYSIIGATGQRQSFIRPDLLEATPGQSAQPAPAGPGLRPAQGLRPALTGGTVAQPATKPKPKPGTETYKPAATAVTPPGPGMSPAPGQSSAVPGHAPLLGHSPAMGQSPVPGLSPSTPGQAPVAGSAGSAAGGTGSAAGGSGAPAAK